LPAQARLGGISLKSKYVGLIRAQIKHFDSRQKARSRV